MPDPAAAVATQLKNIEARSGRTLAQLREMLAACGLERHAEARSWLMRQTGLGYGDANAVVHLARQAAEPPAADPLDAIYAGAKAALRPLHDQVIAAIEGFGPFETAPKKSYVSLRRKKQFAMVGPATKEQIEIGLNAKDLPAHPRLKILPAGGMCQAAVRLARANEVDETLRGWLRAAYDTAG